AEDGIRDFHVTGVQTCALPIFDHQSLSKEELVGLLVDDEWLYRENRKLTARLKVAKFKEREAAIENIDYRTPRGLRKTQVLDLRSEERRVGKERRYGGHGEHEE